MELFRYLAIPLVLTLIIETLVLYFLKERRKRVFLLLIGMNVITNISLNLIGYYVEIEQLWVYVIMIIILEAIIWIIEGIGYFIEIKDKRKAILYTLACNGMSFF
ncbi:MAG: hypothetical protein NC310_04540 [Roseburia sp.]|nr:hypothetical protein [Anaeroplasma bactoclasticum]MCM1196329.1 hypothetical protein [Roseburia sp.]MCM1557560.1 hypothetical protein [Anaeroplasma bactoclasticum]